MIFNQVRQNLEVGDQMTAPNISRNIDHALNELIDLISRDYIFYFFGNLMGSSESSQRILKEDFWIVIKAFCERLSKVVITFDDYRREEKNIQGFIGLFCLRSIM